MPVMPGMPSVRHPLYSLIPYDSNPHFVGREKLLRDIRDNLSTSDPRKYRHRVALHGLAGVGKTQLAIAYVHSNKELYTGVFWIRAADQTSLLSSFLEIANITRCITERAIAESSPPDVAKSVLSWLRHQTNWLLVYDNVDDVSVVDGYLPQMTDGGHVLITTRNPNSMSIPAEGVHVDLLEPDDAAELFRIRAPLESGAPFSEEITAEVKKIVAELGFLPLAIEQAAGFIRETGIDILKFLPIYDKSRKNLLHRKSSTNTHYSSSVAATFQMSFQKVRNMACGLAAAKLLSLFAFLNPDNISIDFLEAGKDGLNGGFGDVMDDPMVFYAAIAALRQFSLIGRSTHSGSISIHRLVQAVVKDDLSDADIDAYQYPILGLCDSAFPSELSNDTRPLCRRYQAQVTGPLLAIHNVQLVSSVKVLLRVGQFLRDDGKYEDSKSLLQNYVNICKNEVGDEDLETVKGMASLASTYRELGEAKQAATLQAKVLDVRTRTLGEHHPDTLRSMNDSASTCGELGQTIEAAQVFETVLEARTIILGAEHADTLTSMNDLASTYGELGRTSDAANMLKRVLETRRKVFGEDHPDTLRSTHDLGSTFGALGHIEEAVALFEKVWEARKALLGEDHPDALKSMNSLAWGYGELGRQEDAARLYVKALEVRRKILGDDHIDTLRSMNSVATIYGEQGRLVDATVLFEKVLEMRIQIYGDEYIETLRSMRYVAWTYRERGLLEDAVKMYQRVMEIMKRRLGNEHLDTLKSMHGMAITYWYQGKLDHAARLGEQVLQARTRILGEQHPETQISLVAMKLILEYPTGNYIDKAITQSVDDVTRKLKVV